ncbi:MAG: leucine-rich repeat protein [Treponema sp.]|jgi:hypothetical protein|nr:leucine-rich repeat protein [Treponema sp.]
MCPSRAILRRLSHENQKLAYFSFLFSFFFFLISLFFALSCIPKKTAELTSGDDFFFDNGIGDYPEYPQFAVDDPGDCFIFCKNKALQDICLTGLGFDDDINLYEKDIFTCIPNEISTFFIMASVSETIPSRGISFTDENGSRRFFYIARSGMDGSASLMEFQNNPPAQPAPADYIGSFGPAGGIIFYDKGDDQGGWRYLETAPDGYEFTAIWGLGYQALDGLSAAIGTGKRNTEIIVQALKCASSNTDEFDYYERYYKDKAAADICASLNINGYDDWFLPSAGELRMMYENVFKEYSIHHYAAYWSSSDDGDESTWFYNFDDGTRDTAHAGRDMAEYAVFAVRAFLLNPAQTASSDFQMDGTTLTRYAGKGGSVTIPPSVTEIGEAAFIVVPGESNGSPTSVTIPASVTAIRDRAFQNCASLTSVTFSSPSSVTYIGEYAFLGCGSPRQTHERHYSSHRMVLLYVKRFISLFSIHTTNTKKEKYA